MSRSKFGRVVVVFGDASHRCPVVVHPVVVVRVVDGGVGGQRW